MVLRDFELGAMQVHILYHAAQQPVYGSWMAQELAHHGFAISYGTLYPMLHRMHSEGLLACREQRDGSQMRKYYTATAQGKQELVQVQRLVRELSQEVGEGIAHQPLGLAEADARSREADAC